MAIELLSTERALAQIWCDVLSVQSVQPADDFFFDLGGDSLAAKRVLLQIEQIFGVRMSIVDFFERATIRELAQRIAS